MGDSGVTTMEKQRHGRVVESDLARTALPLRQQQQVPAPGESARDLIVLAALGLILLGLVVAGVWIGVLSIIDAVQGHPLASWHHVLTWLDSAKWYALWLGLLIVVYLGLKRGWSAYKAIDDHRTEKQLLAAEVHEREQRDREYDLRQEELRQRDLESQRVMQVEMAKLAQAYRIRTMELQQIPFGVQAIHDGEGQLQLLPAVQIEQTRAALPPAGRQLKEQMAQHSAAASGDLASSDGEEDREEAILIPEKPLFWEIADLITTERMPLCCVVDDDPASRWYGQTVPQFGTIDDLLSLAVIGKPGKGKTVWVIYYTTILAVYGAEIHIFDPHGTMGELALLHGRPLPGMPATARIYYYDRKDTMMQAVKVLKVEMDDRDVLYRPHMEDGEMVSRKVKHPLLILADELPILAEFDNEVRAEYKERNQGKAYSEREEVPSLIHLIKRTVLEARKWRMFFIGSSQSIDASILPTKVTDALNSRIVFFNSDRKARLVGLEADVIKKMLPLIRRAGPGMTIYDCARWDAPKIGAIPNICVDDMLQFLGVDLDALTESWVVESGRSGGVSGRTGVGQDEDTFLGGSQDKWEESKIVPLVRPDAPRKATYNDAVQVWNDLGGNVGRVQMQNELSARGFACGPNQARTFVESIKKSLEDRMTGIDGCVDG